VKNIIFIIRRIRRKILVPPPLLLLNGGGTLPMTALSIALVPFAPEYGPKR
jgi:hypothetical protein